MKNLKSIFNVIGLIVKYGAIVGALIKALNCFYDEIQQIELDEETKKTVKDDQ